MSDAPLPLALMAVQPVCPACLRSLPVYDDVVDRQITAVTREVVCVCGWFGRTRLVMEQPIDVQPPMTMRELFEIYKRFEQERKSLRVTSLSAEEMSGDTVTVKPTE